jgi:hypothetical protein
MMFGFRSSAEAPSNFCVRMMFSTRETTPIKLAGANVVYEDDSVRSNRRVPNEILGGLEGDEPARGFIMAQDREIAEKGGRPALSIKRIERVGAKKK